jgi:hypothetical protein
MKRLAIIIVAIGVLAAACGSGGPSSLGRAPGARSSTTRNATPSTTTPTTSFTPATTTPSATVAPTTTPATKPFTFEVWFSYRGRLFVTKRTEPFVPAVGGLALDALLRGPVDAEEPAGVSSAIPPGSTAGIKTVEGGVATVDLKYPAGSPAASPDLAKAQIVYTLTQYPTITKVQFVGQEGTASRADFVGLLPAILVQGPLLASRVSSPVTISGTADVYEATVNARILDASGNEIGVSFTTATCGTGCRGDYTMSVPFSVNAEQAGTIQVLDYSPKDGSPENVVDIPVTLVP